MRRKVIGAKEHKQAKEHKEGHPDHRRSGGEIEKQREHKAQPNGRQRTIWF